VKPKENFGMLIKGDNQKIFYTGEMFYPSGMDVSSLEADIVLVPIGGFYTFGPKEAIDYVKRFKKIGKIIPMHYHKTPEKKGEFEKLFYL
ncbi:MAG: MBL fold metallo-hydrolase, partial [Patescibacteria group bacterium]